MSHSFESKLCNLGYVSGNAVLIIKPRNCEEIIFESILIFFAFTGLVQCGCVNYAFKQYRLEFKLKNFLKYFFQELFREAGRGSAF